MTRLAVALWLGVAILVAGCGGPAGKPTFELTDVTGAGFARDFNLADHKGTLRSLADFKGKVVAVFFGFMHCPDVCPATMSELAMVMKELGKDAERVQVLFVTVDPERDTPAVLSQYVPAFHPSFLGLHGDADAIARVAKEFKVVHQKHELPGGGYSMDHSAGTFIFDPAGRLRLFAQHGRGAPALLHDIRLLLSAS